MQIALAGAAISPGGGCGLTWSGAAGWAGRCTGRGRRCCSASGSEGTSERIWEMDGEGYQSGYGPLSAYTEAAVPRHPCCIPSAASPVHHPRCYIPNQSSHVVHPQSIIPCATSRVPFPGYHIPRGPGGYGITGELQDLLAERGPQTLPACSTQGLFGLNPESGSCNAGESRVKCQDWESPTPIPQCGLQALPSPAPSAKGWQSPGQLLEVLR